MNYVNLHFRQSAFFGITLILVSCNNLFAMNNLFEKFTKIVATTISKNGNETIEELLSNGDQNDIATFYSRIINIQAAACIDIFDEGGDYSDPEYKNPTEKALEYIRDRLTIAQDFRIIKILDDLAAKDTGDNLTKAIHNAQILHSTFIIDVLNNAKYYITDQECRELLDAHKKIIDRMGDHNTLYKQACYYCGCIGIDLRSLVRKTGLLVGCAGTTYILYKVYIRYSNTHQRKAS